MKEKLLNIKLPLKYEDGIIEFIDGLDNVPNWIEFSTTGHSKEEYKKMNLLVDIERMKHELNQYKNELTIEEMEYIEQLINDSIEKYNNI